MLRSDPRTSSAGLSTKYVLRLASNLSPVRFVPKGIPQFGLVAEEVEKMNGDWVARDDQGKVYTVRYQAVNAMLLNEFLKEHRKVEEQQATITELESKVAKQELSATRQQKQIEALSAT